MRQHPVERGKAFVARVHVAMAVMAIVLSALCTLFGLQAGLAVLAGSAAVLLPQMFAAQRLLKPFSPRRAMEFNLALWFYQGLKWVLTCVLLWFAYARFREQALFVLIGFIVIFQGLWITPLILSRKGSP